MASAHLRKMAKAVMDETVWAACDAVHKGAMAESGPLRKDGNDYTFNVKIFPRRGYPKIFKIKVSEDT